MAAWALIVGIDQYTAAAKLNTLRGAVADAADFADWALAPDGGGVAHDQLFFWTYPAPANPGPHLGAFLQNPNPWPYEGPIANRAPTAMDIVKCVPKLADRAVSQGATRLYVFFAGHGGMTAMESHTEDPQNCFIAGDFDLDQPTFGLVGCDDVRRYLQLAGPPELVLIFDCCRSELSLKVSRPASPFNRINAIGAGQKRLGICRAAQDGGLAYEFFDTANGVHRGAFSKMVVSALRQHRVNDRLILRDLDEYVTAGIGNLVAPNVQVPDFLEKPKPPVLALVGAASALADVAVNIRFEILPIGTDFQIQNDKLELVASAKVADGSNQFSLPFGSYVVELPDGTELTIFHHLGPGETNVNVY